MLYALTWWLALSLIGLLALPLTLFTLRHLPDRGYAASRVLGVLVVSYVAWLVHYRADFKVALAAGVVTLAALSFFFGRGLWGAHRRFLRQRAAYVLFVELLFLVFLLLGTHYKTVTGAIAETEKPADFTMLNSLMSARRMPPHDPWLSGAPISYYYFGYYIVGLLARITDTPAGIAFNVGLALVWALTALMGFAVGYALTQKRRYGLLLAFTLTLLGNLDFWFRAVHVYQYGDLREKYLLWPENPTLRDGLTGVLQYVRDPVGHNWDYWHASRIIDATKGERLITEFPGFSFFLGDLHPHVMSLPFFLLALALSLHLLKAPLPGWGAFGSRLEWQGPQILLLGITYGSLGFLNSWDFPTVMLVLAVSLALREMWALGRGLSVRWFLSFAKVGLPIAFLAFASYLPFYRALQTQLQGIEVVKDRTDLYYWPFLFGTFLLVLVPALVLRARGVNPAKPAAGEAVVERAKKEKPKKKERRVEPASRVATAPARPQCVLCGAPPGEGSTRICGTCGGEIVDPRPPAELPDAGLRKWVGGLGSWLSGAVSPWGRVLVVAALALAAVDLTMSRRAEDLGNLELAGALERMTYQMDDPAVTIFSVWLVLLALGALTRRNETRELAFAHVLAAFGFATIAACEWFYFKDLFSMFPHLARMNTVFKFYIHAWVLLAAASVPLLAWLLRAVWPRWPKPIRAVWAGLAGMVMVASVSYPCLTYYTRVTQSTIPASLDGTEHFRTYMPEEAHAVDWLLKAHPDHGEAPPPVILEAWHGSFTEAGRIATYTGFATVLGWEGHEEQWRGRPENVIRGGIDETDTVRRRYEDVSTLYTTFEPAETRRLLKRYNVHYVYVGRFERTRFPGAPFDKWASLGKLVFSEGGAEMYDVSGS